MHPLKLKHIVAVDRSGSLTAAARTVHVTQSALTKNIADIEGELGFSLFERHARGVVATVQGRAFIDRAARLVSDFELLMADAKAGRQLSASYLRVGVSPPSLVTLLNRALPGLLQRYPNVRIEETALWIEQSIHYLSNRDIDILVGPAPLIMRQHQFVCHTLAPFEVCFFARKGHPLSSRRRLAIGELSQFPMALADKSVATPELMSQLFGAPEIPVSKQLHIIGDFSAACGIVAKSDTIATVSASYRENSSFQNKFSILNVVDRVDPIPLVVAHHAKFLPSPPMLDLVESLVSEPHWAP